MFDGHISEIGNNGQIKTKFMKRIPAKDGMIFVFPDDTEDDDNVWKHNLSDVFEKILIPISVEKLLDV